MAKDHSVHLNVVKQMEKNQTLHLLLPSIEYNDMVVEIANQLSGKTVCYVTLNKTYDSLLELFKKNKVPVKNFVFVDAISKTMKKTPDQTEGAFFVSSPSALNEMAIMINKFIEHGIEYIVFDSITNLSIYHQEEHIAEFVSTLINKIKASKTKALFYALNIKEQEELIKEICMFADDAIDLSK